MENLQLCTTDLPLESKKLFPSSSLILSTYPCNLHKSYMVYFFPFRCMLTSLLTFCNPSILGIMQTEFCQHLTVPSRDPSKWRVLASYTSHFRVNLEHFTYCMEDSMLHLQCFLKSLILGGESPAESQMLSQERIHIRGKNVKTLCFDVIFYLLGFSHFVALCTSWFLFRPWYPTIWKNINLRVWIIEGRNPLGYVRVATTAFEQTHMTFFLLTQSFVLFLKAALTPAAVVG